MCERVDDVRRVVVSETGWAVSACGADCAWTMGCVRWVVVWRLGSEVMVEVAVCFLSASEEAACANNGNGFGG